jgi:hypothetical protein
MNDVNNTQQVFALFHNNDIMSIAVEKPKSRKNAGKQCSNCFTSSSPLWRKGPNDCILCNKCGVYWSRHHKLRPADDTKITKPKPNKSKKFDVSMLDNLDLEFSIHDQSCNLLLLIQAVQRIHASEDNAKESTTTTAVMMTATKPDEPQQIAFVSFKGIVDAVAEEKKVAITKRRQRRKNLPTPLSHNELNSLLIQQTAITSVGQENH